jgi:hypothetical protein
VKIGLFVGTILISLNFVGQNNPSIVIFQSNLHELSMAFEKRAYETIHKFLHHKNVSEERMINEVELAIKDSILPPEAIKMIDKWGEFGVLTTVIKDEMAYKRYLEKAEVNAKDCFAYFREINGIDIFVIAEWKETYFRFIRIKNLKALLY